MKNKERIIYIIIIFLLCMTCLFLLYLNYKNLDAKQILFNENVKLEEQNQSLEYLVNHLSSTLPPTEGENKDCTFIQTLYYIDTIDYQGQINEKYVLLKEFQGSYPIMVRLEPDFTFEFQNNKAYEITFKGNTANNNDSSLIRYQIQTIKETNKIGLDQIQESCQ